MIDAMEKLASGKIDVHEAATIAKGSETVMSSLKLQLTYSNMLGEVPYIEFLHDCHEGEPIEPKKLAAIK